MAAAVGNRSVAPGPPTRWVTYLLVGLVLGVSYPPFPLYHSNQNQYFFHGLVKAGVGLLEFDWLAQTKDPVPAFSLIVYLTQRYLDERLFFVYYLLLMGVFAYSLLGIVSPIYGGPRGSSGRSLGYLALLIALVSPVLGEVVRRAVGVNIGWHLMSGVALQGVLSPIFQPSLFGVLLILSVYLFLHRGPIPAVVTVSLAATVHPTYLLSAGALTLAYLVVMARRGEPLGRILAVGLLGLVSVVPIASYVYLNYRPAAPEIWREAQEILVNVRGPWHTVPARWLGTMAYLKVAVIVAAVFLARRTDLAVVMLLPFLVAVVLTTAQIILGSHTLTMFLPWRLSVFLVPISTSVVLAHGLAALLGGAERRLPRLSRLQPVVSTAVLVALVGLGAGEMARRSAAVAGEPGASMLRFVRETRLPGQQYVIPLDLEKFRLSTGAPVFVDFNFAPYRDVEVVEWRKRLKLAQDFYQADGDLRCRRLRELATHYSVTHVVLRGQHLDGCREWALLFEDGTYRLYGKGSGSAQVFILGRGGSREVEAERTVRGGRSVLTEAGSAW